MKRVFVYWRETGTRPYPEPRKGDNYDCDSVEFEGSFLVLKYERDYGQAREWVTEAIPMDRIKKVTIYERVPDQESPPYFPQTV